MKLGNFFKKVLCGTLIGGMFLQNTYAIIDVGVNFSKNNTVTGEIIDYTIRINNSNNQDSINVNFEHSLPEGVFLVDNQTVVDNCGNEGKYQLRNDSTKGIIKLVGGVSKGTNFNGGSCESKFKVYGKTTGNREAIFELNTLTATSFDGNQEANNEGNASRSSLNVTHLLPLRIARDYENSRLFYNGNEKFKAAFTILNDNHRGFTAENGQYTLRTSNLGITIDENSIKTSCSNDVELLNSKDIKFNSFTINPSTFCKIEFEFTVDGYLRIPFHEVKNNGNGFYFDDIKDLNVLLAKTDGTNSNILVDNGEIQSSGNQSFVSVSPKMGIFTYVERNSQLVTIIGEGETTGEGTITFNFFSGSYRENFDFKHDFPLSKDGNSQLKFKELVRNNCGGNVTGQGTNRFQLQGGIIGVEKEGFNNVGYNRCEVVVKVEGGVGQYESTLNYKDNLAFNSNDKINNSEVGKKFDLEIKKVNYGLFINKYLDYNTSDGKEHVTEIYEIKNTTNEEINYQIKTLLEKDGNQRKKLTYDLIGVKNSCGESVIENGKSEFEKIVGGLSIKGGGTCIVEIQRMLKKDHAYEIVEGGKCSTEVLFGILEGEVSIVQHDGTLIGNSEENVTEDSFYPSHEHYNGLAVDEMKGLTLNNYSDKYFTIGKTYQGQKRIDIPRSLFFDGKREAQIVNLKIPRITDKIEFIEKTMTNDQITCEETGLARFNCFFNGTVEVKQDHLLVNGKVLIGGKVENQRDGDTEEVELFIDYEFKIKDNNIPHKLDDLNQSVRFSENRNNIFANNEDYNSMCLSGISKNYFVTENKNVESSRIFTKTSIIGGEKTNLEITLTQPRTNTNNYTGNLYFDLKENLSDFVLLPGSNILIKSGNYNYIERTITPDEYEISDDGILTIKGISSNINFGSNKLVLEVTSVKGGNRISSGGANYIVHSGHEITNSTATLQVLRGFNTQIGFKDNELVEGESTEFFVDIYNSHESGDSTETLTKTFPKGLNVSLKDNKCGGNINLVKGENGETTLTMNGQTLQSESFCRITFDIVGEKSGTYIQNINAGELRTVNGKSNSFNVTDTLVVRNEVGVKLFSNKNTIQTGEKAQILARIQKQGGLLENGVFDLNIPSGITVRIVNDNFTGEQNSELLTKNDLVGGVNKCNYEEGKNIKIEDGKAKVFGEGININHSSTYCDILLEVTGDGIGNKTLKATNFLSTLTFETKESNELNIEVVNKQVTVKHIDLDTNQPVYTEENLTSNGQPKTDNVNYEYVRGESSDNGSTYTHYYRKKDGKVIIKYLDKADNSVIKQQVEVTHKWGDTYNVEGRNDEIQNYTYDSTTGQQTGTISANETVIIHLYNKKQGNVVVEYKLLGTDQNIGETTYTENKKWGDAYDVRDKKKTDLENYTYVSTTGNEQGIVGANEVKITHNYTKKSGSITVKYVDKDTGTTIKTEEVLRTNYLDTFDTRDKKVEIENYNFDSVVGTEQGTMGKTTDGSTVTYKYAKKDGKIYLRYLRTGTNQQLGGQVVIAVKFGETYDLTNQIEEFKGFTYVRTEGDQEKGTVNKEETIINHYYDEKQGTIKVKHLDIHTNETVHNDETFTIGLGFKNPEDLAFTASEKIINGYSFNKIKDGDNKNLSFKEGEQIVTFYYTKDNRKQLTIRFVDENGELVRPVEIINKTDTGYEITDEMINDFTDGSYLKFIGPKKGDVLNCSNLECLNDESIDLVFERKKINLNFRHFIRNIEDNQACSIFGMEYFDEDNNREMFIKYRDEILNKELGMFTKPAYIPFNDKTIDSGDGFSFDGEEIRNLCIDTTGRNGAYGHVELVYGKNIDEVMRFNFPVNRNIEMGTNKGIRETESNKKLISILKENGINDIYNFRLTPMSGIDDNNIYRNIETGEYNVDFELVRENITFMNVIKFLEEGTDVVIKDQIEILGNHKVGERFDMAEYLESEIGDYEISYFNGIEGYYNIEQGNPETIVYYKKKKGNITVKYTGDRGETLENNFVKEFNFGDEYLFTTRDFEDYDLTSIIKDGEVITDTNGTVTKDNHVIEFKYTKKQGNLIVQYIDSETGDIVKTTTEKVRYGDQYNHARENIPLYGNDDKVEGNTTGTIDRNNNEVIIKYYVTHNKGSLSVKAIDKETKQEIGIHNLTGNVGDPYRITPHVIENYTYDSHEGDLEGNYVQGNKEVILFFVKKTGNIKIRYIDKDTGAVIEEIISNGKVGERINVNKKEITGHTFDSSIDLTNIVVKEGENIIDLFYNRNSGSVTIKYVDENGKEIKEPKVISGKYGDKYETNIEIPEGYTFVSSVGNTTGTINGETVVTVNFKKNEVKKPEVVDNGRAPVSGPGGYVVPEDNRVKTTINIIEEPKKEIKEPVKQVEEKKEPTIILEEPKFIFEPVEPMNLDEEIVEEETKQVEVKKIKLPKTGTDSTIEDQVRIVISENGNIKDYHKEELVKAVTSELYARSFDKLHNNVEITIKKGSTEYKFTISGKNGDHRVEQGMTVVLDNNNELQQNDIKNLVAIGIIVLGVISVISIIFILKRRNKKLDGFDTLN